MQTIAYKTLGVLSAVSLLLSGCGSSSKRVDFVEQEMLLQKATIEGKLPDVPRSLDGMVIVEPTAFDSVFTYGVDPKSLSMAGYLVRYAIVSQSDAGIKNITLETIHCSNRTFQITAIVGEDGQWKVQDTASWSPLYNTRNMAAQYLLARDVFCAGNGIAGADTEDLVYRLRHWRDLVR